MMKIDGVVYLQGRQKAEADIAELIKSQTSFTQEYFDVIQEELYRLLDWNLLGATFVEWKLGYVDGVRNEIIRLRKMVRIDRAEV